MLRDKFHLPTDGRGAPLIYFCGNSLGLQPRAAGEQLERELATWRERGVEGWWHGGWLDYHRRVEEGLARLVGAAEPAEVVAANALTVNLHLLLTSFFVGRGRRCKVITEAGAFPSDQYALASQLRLRGLDPADCLITVGEDEDAVEVIERVGGELALVLWGGVHYYTGRHYDLGAIAAAGRRVGARVGLDLAHAIGNVPLRLHDWGVDFAVWCSYKYLNGGPGAPGGMFVHQRHAERDDLPRLAGWWGHRQGNRFAMRPDFVPERGAAGWQLSTVPVLGLAPLVASLPLFAEAGGMTALRRRSEEITGRLYEQLANLPGARILTPAEPAARGAQVSVFLSDGRPELEARLSERGLIVDYRHDNLGGSGGGVLRLAPAPLYNTVEEVDRAVVILQRELENMGT